MIDVLLIGCGILCIAAGLLGSILPVLPGPPLSYAGLILLQLTSTPPFGWVFMIFWLAVVIIFAVFDNVIPVWATKRSGGSAYGIWGSVAGLIIGFFFPPIGILIGPLVGAFVGELVAGQTKKQSVEICVWVFFGVIGRQPAQPYSRRGDGVLLFYAYVSEP